MAGRAQFDNHLQQSMYNFNNNVPNANAAGKDNKAGYDAGNYQFGSYYQVPEPTLSPGVLSDGMNGNYAQNYVGSDPGYYATNDYYGCYYPGYDGSNGQVYYGSTDGLNNIQYPVAQVDNSQFVYYNQWYHHGYDALASVAPGTVGIDGQIAPYQPVYTGTAFQQPSSHQLHYPPPAYGTNFFSPNTWEGAPLGVKSTGRSSLTGGVRPLSKSIPSSFKLPTSPVKAVAPKYSNFTGKEDKRYFNSSRNQPIKSDKAAQHITALPPSTALAKGYIPIAKFSDKAPVRYYSATKNTTGSELFGPERLRGRSKVNGTTCYDSIYEQNRGPRLSGQKILPPSNSDSTGQGDVNKITSTFREGQYNLPEFQTAYEKARFFVIKSYSEDDVHKSIKYGAWCSTLKGNKKLDLAYQFAQKKVEEKSSLCPVFLFFSVNASGHFCGVAEMTSRVDFEKKMDFWLQDKWIGVFPVKWHIIKDVPHSQFRHIKLDNNDYQPVTSSRDTQEVKLEHGIEMLNIFKNYAAKTSIRDDFEFYDNREKLMHDERILFGAYSTNVRKSVDGRQVNDESLSVGKDDEIVSVGKDVEVNDTTKDVSDPADDKLSVSKDVELNDTTNELNDTAKDVGDGLHRLEVALDSARKNLELTDTAKDAKDNGDVKTISSEIVSVSKDVELNDPVKDVSDLKSYSADEVAFGSEDTKLNDTAEDAEVASGSEDTKLNDPAEDAGNGLRVAEDGVVSVSKEDPVKDISDLKTFLADEVASGSEDTKLNDTADDAGDGLRVAEDGDVETYLSHPTVEVVSVSKDVELKDTAND